MNRLFFFLLFSISFVANAQENGGAKVWSLKDCMEYALEHNLQIKIQELQTKISRSNLIQSELQWLPSVNAQATQNYSFGRNVDRFTNEFSNTNVRSNNFYLGGSVTLFNGFQRVNGMIQNRYDLLANLQMVEKVKNDIRINIATAYLQILFNKELVTIIRQQYEVTSQQVEKTKIQVESGIMARGALLDIEAQQASENLKLVTCQNDLDLSRLVLAQLLELDSVKNFNIEQPLNSDLQNEHIEISVNEAYSYAQDNFPQIKSAGYRLRSFERQLSSARGQRLPQLSLSAYYYTGYSDARKMPDINLPFEYSVGKLKSTGEEVVNTGYGSIDYPFADQLRDNASKVLEIQLTIPIFNNWQIQNKVSTTKVQLLETKYRMEQTEKDLFKEIQQAFSGSVAALAKYQAAYEAEAAYEESFNYAKQKFEAGLVNSIEYNTAKNQYAKAQSDALQAKYDYLFRKKLLMFYEGKKLE